MNPKLIKMGKLIVAGVTGDGRETKEAWERLMKLDEAQKLANKLSENSYEVRLYGDNESTVHVGFCVSDLNVPESYTVVTLPASQYASFEVYVANGYESENNAMDEWLASNAEGYAQRYLSGKSYVVEYYDERFNGAEKDSIVEIWVPVEKVR